MLVRLSGAATPGVSESIRTRAPKTPPGPAASYSARTAPCPLSTPSTVSPESATGAPRSKSFDHAPRATGRLNAPTVTASCWVAPLRPPRR